MRGTSAESEARIFCKLAPRIETRPVPVRKAKAKGHRMTVPERLDALRFRLPSVDQVALQLYAIEFKRGQARCPFPQRHRTRTGC